MVFLLHRLIKVMVIYSMTNLHVYLPVKIQHCCTYDCHWTFITWNSTMFRHKDFFFCLVWLDGLKTNVSWKMNFSWGTVLLLKLGLHLILHCIYINNPNSFNLTIWRKAFQIFFKQLVSSPLQSLDRKLTCHCFGKLIMHL